ncbi:hypothetical protein PR001_g31653 [Phytophthora rubi]|uniref:Uncharacterized protein n=1 Tax=Phytophthora rubi TaxID=129364 RepID=A0A6A3GH51_9STRA|nr:hypothetical protein PR001_g31653 [Phytophthora rubi]
MPSFRAARPKRCLQAQADCTVPYHWTLSETTASTVLCVHRQTPPRRSPEDYGRTGDIRFGEKANSTPTPTPTPPASTIESSHCSTCSTSSDAMKFSLPSDTMPKLQLSLRDQQCIEHLASVFVNETVDQYMEHLQAARTQRRPRVCNKRWK